MPVIDLNADLGEEAGDDEAMLDIVTSTAVACGFHAGGPAVMARTARLAAERGVAIGAHPSYDDRAGFGRRVLEVERSELVAGLAYQVGAMRAVATAAGQPLRFVKLHGALYNQAAADPAVADAVVEAAVGAFADLPILCPPASELERRATGAGLGARAEGFADRAYRPDGSLVPRSEAAAVLHDPDEVAAQAVRLARDGRCDSICLHGDTPGAVDLARAVRRALQEAGVAIAAFA